MSGQIRTPLQGDAGMARPSAPVELMDLRFRALLHAEDWAHLPQAVRDRFSKRVGPGDMVIYRGSVTEIRANLAGRTLAQVLRAIGGPLPLVFQPGPAVVTVTEDRVGRGQVWTRCYMRSDGFPQTLHSAKRFTGPTGLEEHLGFGIAMALRVTAMTKGLRFTSDHYLWRLGPVRLRLPRWMEPGRLRIEHRDLGPVPGAGGRGRFAFSLDLHHPLFGRLIHQVAEFDDPVV